MNTALNRRRFLGTAGAGAAALAAACAPGASPPGAQEPTGGGADAEWEQVVAAARNDGEVAIATYAGSGYRAVMDGFQAAYPDVRVQHSTFQSSSRDFVPRLLQEQKAGLYLWDLAFMPNTEMLRQVRSVGGVEPVRPAIFRADVLDDKNWIEGFNAGWRDNDKKWGYAFCADKGQTVWINTDQVKDGEIKSLNDLLNPKWKGRILAADPSNKGSGFWPSTAMRINTKGDEIIRRLFKDQEAAINRDARQLTEFMVRGQYAIGFGAVDKRILQDFRSEGLGKNLKALDMNEIDVLSSGSAGTVWLLKAAPHPSGGKLFLNWLLTKEGSSIWSKNIGTNSRRTDVPVFDEATSPARGKGLVWIEEEDLIDEIEKTQKVAKEALGL